MLLCEGRHLVGVTAGRTVYIVTLEDDCLVLDICHHDIGDKQLLRLAAATHTALETETGVCACETVMADDDTAHTADGLTTQHKTTMGMENGIVLNDDILTAIGGRSWLYIATLHADTIITGIHRTVNDQSDIDITEVDGITILCIPWTAHGDTIYDDILGIARMDMETGEFCTVTPWISTFSQSVKRMMSLRIFSCASGVSAILAAAFFVFQG